MDKSIPPLMCNTPPPMDDGPNDDEDECSVESIEGKNRFIKTNKIQRSISVTDVSAPSTPSKHKSIDNDLPVPDEPPAVPQTPHPAFKHNSLDDSVNHITPDSTPDVDPPPPINGLDPDRDTESPPSLDLHDPDAGDGSFDDPNLDEIPEDDFYTNTDLSLPSLRLDPIPDSPPNVSPTHAASSPDLRTEEDLSIGSKDLIEDEDLNLQPIDAPAFVEAAATESDDGFELPPMDIEQPQKSITSFDENELTHSPIGLDASLNDSFDDFVEYSDAFKTNFVDTDFNSNQMNESPQVVTTSNNDRLVQSGDLKPDEGEEFCLKSTLNDNFTIPDEHQSIEFNTDSANDDAAFAVDFSQFNATETTNEKPGFSPAGDDDDDDDFGDFNDAPAPAASAANFSATDDDFGDFSNFQNPPASIPMVQTDLKVICAQTDSLLAMMFPGASATNETDEVAANANGPSKPDEDLLSDITLAVRNVDDSKALQHQWLTSTGKSSLVRALGIDSRNIVSCNQSHPSHTN